MGQRKPGTSFNALQKASRRRRNSATISVTQSWGPDRAAIPARWVKLAVQEFELTINLFTASTSHSGITPYPIRQPVIAYVLEKPSSRMVCGSISGKLAMETGGSP